VAGTTGVAGPDPRQILHEAFRAAVAAAAAASWLPGCLPSPPRNGRTLLAGAGKAAAAMAEVLVADYGAPVSGVVVTRYGHGLPGGRVVPGVEVIEAGHPVPDAASVEAGSRILALARSAGPRDLFVFLMSGGASALMVQPVRGVTLADKQAITRQLLLSGADIRDINTVRRKLSRIKGGRLALASAAGRTCLLAMSDVPGDHVADIGSGPLSPDPTRLADARAVIARNGCVAGNAVAAALLDPANESPHPAHPAFGRVTSTVGASSADAVRAAAAALGAAGIEPVILPPGAGPATELATVHAQRVRELRAQQRCCALVSGGETTVSIGEPAPVGGRNTQYLLALACELAGDEGVDALAADTDGLDGSGDNAGAWLAPDSLERARLAGLDPVRLLAGNRAVEFFAALGDLLITGPTRTNVNDLRIVMTGGDRGR
jgi:hydroxypyruvate reductase